MKLGDVLNGYAAEANFETLDEAATFLDVQARKHFPESDYALGPIELERRRMLKA